MPTTHPFKHYHNKCSHCEYKDDMDYCFPLEVGKPHDCNKNGHRLVRVDIWYENRDLSKLSEDININ